MTQTSTAPGFIARHIVPGTDFTIELRRNRSEFSVHAGGYVHRFFSESDARDYANTVWGRVRQSA